MNSILNAESTTVETELARYASLRQYPKRLTHREHDFLLFDESCAKVRRFLAGSFRECARLFGNAPGVLGCLAKGFSLLPPRLVGVAPAFVQCATGLIALTLY